MASRYLPDENELSELPARLAFNAELYFEEWGYFDPENPDVEFTNERGLARLAARHRVDDARQEYLSKLTVRPRGARVADFLQAHGFTYADNGTPKTRHLSY